MSLGYTDRIYKGFNKLSYATKSLSTPSNLFLHPLGRRYSWLQINHASK